MGPNIIRTLRGVSTTTYNAELNEQLTLFDAVKKQTDKVVNAILCSISELNANNLPNKWEHFGEVVHNYGSTSIDNDAGVAMRKIKPFMDELGHSYRLYSKHIEEQVTQPLQSWVKNEYKQMHDEIKKLEKYRDAMDSAIDKARRATDNAELETIRIEAERNYNFQLQLVSERLNSFFNNQHKSHLGILRKFVELQHKLYFNTAVKLQEAAATINI